MIIAPNGSNGSMIDPGGTLLQAGTNIYHATSSVVSEDYTFSNKIHAGSDVDTGSYLVVVLSKGMDGIYRCGYDNLTAALAPYDLTGKTQEQVLAILENATVSAAGSDDLMWTGYIDVDLPFVSLHPIADVAVGEPLVVTGTSNRKEGHPIVVTVKGAIELTPQMEEVEKGTFSATFDTSTAPAGMYTVKADDGDGHTDETFVNIVTPLPFTVNLSADIVSLGSSFEVYGSSPSDYVEIVTISPKGGNGTGMDGLYGVSIYTVPTFNSGDTGSYKIIGYIDPETIDNLTISEPLSINDKNNLENETVVDINVTGPKNNTIIIIKEEITIEAEKTTPSREEEVLFTVKAPLYKLFNFSTTYPEDVMMTSYEDNPLGLPLGEEVPMDTVSGNFNATTDESGTFKIVAYFTENGTYPFRVWYDANTYADATGNERDVIDLNVEEEVTEFYKKIKLDSGADTGNYTILVLTPGRDEIYGYSWNSYIDSILDLDGAGPEPGAVDVSNKTKEEIVSIIKNATIDQAESDDLIWAGHLKVYQRKIIYVDDDFEDDPANHRWNTIQEGVNDANDGWTVIVYNGTYYENVIVNESIELVGECQNTTIIDGGGNNDVVNVTADNCTIRGFKVRNGNGGIMIYKSSNNTITGNNACSNNCGGIDVQWSNNNTITNNTANSNSIGIHLETSSNNMISNNILNLNKKYGIKLTDSSNYNTVSGNTASSNDDIGITLGGGYSNNVLDNAITNNDYGISLSEESSNNLIYHNNIINNTNQACDDYGNNSWDIGYPSGGNYWSDWTSPDNCSGVYQNESGSDGIVDNPYLISGGFNQDRYPFVSPNGWLEENISVFDTGPGTYPSISGTHNGTITPFCNINVSKLYTYPCPGTGGHTGYAALSYPNGTVIAEAHWHGYKGDWHNISFNRSFTLQASETYNYTVRTGSYPQIRHTDALPTANGWMNCTEFIDANGRVYYDWIPAIRLWAE